MKTNKFFIIILFAVVIILVIGTICYVWIKKSGAPPTVVSEIKTFEECAAKYPVLETYPRQCKTPDGRSFVENIGNELEKQDFIRLTSPRPNQSVRSPLQIMGQARGMWYFEASFPIKIFDANGKQLGIAIAQAQGDWMTENFVAFQATLEFEKPATKTGELVFQKDNPSGDPAKDDALRIPVKFSE